VVICQDRGADLHMAQLIATHCLLLQEIQIRFGFMFLMPAHLGSPGQNLEGHKMVVVVVVPARQKVSKKFNTPFMPG